MTTETKPAPTQPHPIYAALAHHKKAIENSLPSTVAKYLTPERVLRIAWTNVQSHNLLHCDPLSVATAVVEAAQLGLEPNNALGHAYLVPYGKQCTLIIGYKGLIALARRSGEISTIYAHCVHEKDDYQLVLGDDEKIIHVPAEVDDPGPVRAAYAISKLKDGGVQRCSMWRREIEAIKSRSAAGNKGPWKTDYEEMCKKTVLKRLCKTLPMSAELQQAIEIDNERTGYAGLDPAMNVETAREPIKTLDDLVGTMGETKDDASE